MNTNCNKCECENDHEHETIDKNEIYLTVIGIITYIIAVILNSNDYITSKWNICIYAISYILIGYEIFFNAVKKILKKDMFDENFLMTIATFGAFLIGEYTESIAVLLLYKIGEYLQDLAVDRAKDKIKSAIDLKQNYANLFMDNKEEKVSPSKVKIGDVIIIKTGEKIPLDGVIIEGNTIIDNSMLTGETKQIEVKEGNEVLSGSINVGSVIKVKVSKDYENSTVYKIIEMISDATKNKSNTEKFITKFSKIYTPVVIFLAVIICITFPIFFNITYTESISRALKFLVVSCPCALVISIPLSYFVGVGTSSKNNILVKGTNYLDIMSNIKNIVFDKTGTITNGKFEIVKKNIYIDGVEEDKFLEYIAYAESFSNHYLAKSILSSININIDKKRIKNHREISGMGIKLELDDKNIIVGNEKLMKENNVDCKTEETVGAIVHLAVNGEYFGNIVLEDTIRESSMDIISKLKKNGVEKTYLLTGDGNKVSNKIAKEVGIDECYSDLLPDQKQNIVKEIKEKRNSLVAFIGDGINDGPVIALSDVGIAMGSGSDVAVEVSDVVILNNDLNRIIDFIKISKKTKKIVYENIGIILAVKVIFLILSGCGISSMWEAVFADVGISLISILNSLRISRFK